MLIARESRHNFPPPFGERIFSSSVCTSHINTELTNFHVSLLSRLPSFVCLISAFDLCYRIEMMFIADLTRYFKAFPLRWRRKNEIQLCDFPSKHCATLDVLVQHDKDKLHFPNVKWKWLWHSTFQALFPLWKVADKRRSKAIYNRYNVWADEDNK